MKEEKKDELNSRMKKLKVGQWKDAEGIKKKEEFSRVKVR